MIRSPIVSDVLAWRPIPLTNKATIPKFLAIVKFLFLGPGYTFQGITLYDPKSNPPPITVLLCPLIPSNAPHGFSYPLIWGGSPRGEGL